MLIYRTEVTLIIETPLKITTQFADNLIKFNCTKMNINFLLLELDLIKFLTIQF